MSLVTRCPRCRTLFRVTPVQLKARDGKVRCGRCMHAFDGYAALATAEATVDEAALDAAAREPISVQEEALSVERETNERAPETLDAPNAERARAPGILDALTVEPATAPTPLDAKANDEPATSGASAVANAEAARPPTPVADAPLAAAPVQGDSTKGVTPVESAPAASDAVLASPAATERAADAPPRWTRTETEPSPEPFLVAKQRHTGWWASGCVVLVLALVLQIAYAYRGDIAARYPAARPVLSTFCEAAGCSIALPQRPELVKIEASDVHMIDANRPALIQLTATLRSYASYDLAYPALDLVLTNANEHALVRRIFLPHEYVGATRDPRAGIPPNAEITVALELDTGDLDAAGFRLDLRPAPSL